MYVVLFVNSPQRVTCLEQNCLLPLVIRRRHLLQMTFLTVHLSPQLPPQ